MNERRAREERGGRGGRERRGAREEGERRTGSASLLPFSQKLMMRKGPVTPPHHAIRGQGLERGRGVKRAVLRGALVDVHCAVLSVFADPFAPRKVRRRAQLEHLRGLVTRQRGPLRLGILQSGDEDTDTHVFFTPRAYQPPSLTSSLASVFMSVLASFHHRQLSPSGCGQF